MVRGTGAAVVALALCGSQLMPAAFARTVRRTCRDGVSAARTRAPHVLCDVDGRCDGMCTFVVPTCGATTCSSAVRTALVGDAHVERFVVAPGTAPAMLVLRCRRTPRIVRCVTITTTTTGPDTTSPGHVPVSPPVTTSTVVLGGPRPGPTTTTTTGRVTTTTIPVPCATHADCEALTGPCSVGRCDFHDGVCLQYCVCLTTDLRGTCDVDDAKPCATTLECHPVPGDPCRHCAENRCVTVPNCF